MVIRVLIVGVALLVVLIVGGLAFVRYELRARPAKLDAAATGLPVESVTIPSMSGSRLAGWWLPGSGRGAVLLLHGAKSNRLTLVDRMRMLHEAGYGALAIDFQAHGESPGDEITFGERESLDARSALAWLRARDPDDRIAVLGISMGGAAILTGSPIKADAVIVESTFPDLADFVTRRLTNVAGPAGRPLALPLLYAMRLFGVDPWKLRPIDGVRRLHVPIFVMSGTDDKKVTVEESRNLFAAANSPKEYWEVPGAWHVDLAAIGGEAYRERLLQFLNATLRTEDSGATKAR